MWFHWLHVMQLLDIPTEFDMVRFLQEACSMRCLKPVSEHRMRSAMAFLGLALFRDAVATRIGCMLREGAAKNCRSRGPIRHIPMACCRSMIARCSACRILSYPRLCGRVRWKLASQFASAHSAPHNMDGVVDVPTLCRSNCSMCIARFGKLDPTLHKQAKRTPINTVPFRTSRKSTPRSAMVIPA